MWPADDDLPRLSTHLGALLRELRRQRDLSQRELAALVRVPPSTIGRLESDRGGGARLDTVEKVLEGLGLVLAVVTVSRRREIRMPRETGVRDEAGRHYPAHLDVRPVVEAEDWWGAWWAGWYRLPRDRWPVGAPARTFDLSRRRRDMRRCMPTDTDERYE